MRLVVFDIDGTLIDSAAFMHKCVVETFEAEGLEAPTAEDGRRIIGLSLPEALTRLAGTSDEEIVSNLVERYRTIYHENVGAANHEDLYPGARDVVMELSAQPDTLLGIATGKALRGVNRVLNLHGFTPYFMTLQTPDHNPSKPHPSMLFEAMSEAGVEPEQTVMIGDTSFDMEMAVAAGVKGIGVSWGYHEVDEMLDAGAHAIVDEYSYLIEEIDSLVGDGDA